jgi:hypothetical protein
MTTKDGIGAPRHKDVVERDRKVHELIKQRHADGLCTRLSDVRKILDPDLSRSQAFYVLKRLERDRLIERRAGYLWCVVEEG